MDAQATDKLLLPGERIDDLQKKDYRIIQNENCFCFGMDAVLLSHYAKVREGDTVLDLCTGNGVIPLLLEANTKGKHFWGLEIQEYSVDMAKRSVALNSLQDKIDIIEGDVCQARHFFSPSSFDIITCNPPYMNNRHGLTNPTLPKAIARHEILCTLDDIVREAAHLLRPGGSFYMIHRPFRLVEIFQTLCRYKLEPKAMRMVHSFIYKEPSMVLIEAVRGGGSMIKIAPPLVLYERPGVYTEEIAGYYS